MLPWDVWAAVAIAVAAILLVAIFDQSPLLFLVIFFALCTYIVVQAIIYERSGWL
jgi:hypothetical protein